MHDKSPKLIRALGPSSPNLNQKSFRCLFIGPDYTRESGQAAPTIGKAVVFKHGFQQFLTPFFQSSAWSILKPVQE